MVELGAREAGHNLLDSQKLEIGMVLLELGAKRFLRAFEAPVGRPSDFALEGAVRALLPIIRDELGADVEIRWNKNKGMGPEPGSDGAKAIVEILRSLGDQPTQTAILNMIDTVTKDPNGQARSPFGPVIRAHFDEMDATLLPVRRGEKGD